MNNISEQLLSAIDILADEKVSQLRFDKTIQATIYSIADINTGEYKVRYNGNIFAAYSNDTSKTYRAEDEVYVQVPEGDFSNRKIILSLVSATSLTEAELTGLANSINEVSPNMIGEDGIYGVKVEYPYEITSYPSETLVVWENKSTETNNLFTSYAENYEYIQVKASFLTRFLETHKQGSYGLRLIFGANGGNDKVEYTFDTSNFAGSYYNYTSYAHQSVILKVQKGYLTGLKKVEFFSEGFEAIEVDEKTLCVKDIEIKFIEKIDLSSTNYYLYIAQPKGSIVTQSDYFLQARLILQGKDIISSNTKCQWYIADPSVMFGMDSYDKVAGSGWKRLEGKTAITLSLDIDDIKYHNKYKVVVEYNDELTLSAETEVWNNYTTYDFSISQVTEGDKVYLQLNEKLKDNESCVAKWFLLYPDNSYKEIQDNEKISEHTKKLDITEFLQYTSLIFYCLVSEDKEGGQNLDVLEFIVQDSQSEDDVVVRYTGESSFRYDANGDITIEDSEKVRNLAAAVEWKPGYATGYSVSWKLSDGTQITSIQGQAEPRNSMIVNPWVDNYNVLHYNIRQKYKKNYINNTVIVVIKTITGVEYSFEKEIVFVKDGDQGTNGTTYIAAVRPTSSTNYYLKNKSGTYSGSLGLKCTVYKDGEILTDGVKYKWSGFNTKFIDSSGQEITPSENEVTIQGTGQAEASRYVMVQVTITENGKSTNIYASYPIVTLVQGESDTPSFDISNIPQYVKYSSSGRYPSYYSDALEYTVGAEVYNSGIKSENEPLVGISDIDFKQYLSPVTVFNFSEQQIGVLRVPLNADEPEAAPCLYCPIVMYLDTYGNEAINGWDGTKLVIDEDKGEYIFAPQVGAGAKDSYNRFTGVVMGQDSAKEKIGLYGYNKGTNTFGLTAEGDAYFGKEGSQIKLNTSGKVSFTITQTKNGKTSEVFKVKDDGAMTATAGTIGGWAIDEGFLQSPGGNVTLYGNRETGIIINANNKFMVNANGSIEANFGTIGGWTIDQSTLSGGGLTLDSTGYIYFNNKNEYIGRVAGYESTLFGIKATTSGLGAVLQSDKGSAKVQGQEVYLTYTGNFKDKSGQFSITKDGNKSKVFIQADIIEFNATTQNGIRAQFA